MTLNRRCAYFAMLVPCAKSAGTPYTAIIYLSEQESSTTSQAGYKPDEILVTPEMIEAGMAVLRAYSPDVDSISETVREVLIKALARSGRVQAEQG